VKVASVTGAAAGIWAAISKRLARDGIAVGVLDICIEDAKVPAAEIVGAGGRARQSASTAVATSRSVRERHIA
jgi:NAD(P)-dependent dehydrogenase (short-subunit alcohol dehydrogenase family)